MNGVSVFPFFFFLIHVLVSKITLDIICMAAFGYNSNSLRDPHNELAEAYEQLISLQSGSSYPILFPTALPYPSTFVGQTITRFIVILSIPGLPTFLQSKWAYDHRDWIAKIPGLSKPLPFTSNIRFHTSEGDVRPLLDSMHRIKSISRNILNEKLINAGVPAGDRQTKKDIMSLLVKARQVEMEKPSLGTGMEEEEESYTMSDEMIMNQVVRHRLLLFRSQKTRFS